MKTKSYCICEVCGDAIVDVKRGYILHGTISLADPDASIPLLSEKEGAFCLRCFAKKVGFPLSLERSTLSAGNTLIKTENK